MGSFWISDMLYQDGRQSPHGKKLVSPANVISLLGRARRSKLRILLVLLPLLEPKLPSFILEDVLDPLLLEVTLQSLLEVVLDPPFLRTMLSSLLETKLPSLEETMLVVADIFFSLPLLSSFLFFLLLVSFAVSYAAR